MNCAIILSHGSGNFFPGGAVKGIVVWTLENSVYLKGIQLILRGEEYTSWITQGMYHDQVSNTNQFGPITFQGHNEFLKTEINLAEEGTYGPGTLEYPFTFTLPNNCPSTFLTQHGEIHYCIKLTSGKVVKNLEQELKIFVVSPVNFNTMPDLILSPIQYENENHLRFLCCNQGVVGVKLYLEKEAYILGETMKFNVHISNSSNEFVMSLDVRLKMIIKETATVPDATSKATEQIIARLYTTNVQRLNDKLYELSLVIPTTTVLPNFASSVLFETWSILEVEIVLTGCHRNLLLRTKITLGHISRDIEPQTTQPVYVERVTRPTSSLDPSLMVHARPYGIIPLPSTTDGSTKPGNPLETNLPQPSRESSVPYPPGFSTSYLPVPTEIDPPETSSTILSERDPFLTPSGEINGQDQITSNESPPPSYVEAVRSTKVDPPPPAQ